MPYVNRDSSGNISGIFENEQHSGQEFTQSASIYIYPDSAISKTYTDVDAVYAGAVGNRAPEYQQAEQAALAYQAAGYTGAASPYVADYAAAAGITNRQSADIIIARAAGLRAAAQSMRSQRFVSQKAMRDATTQAGLDVAIAAWAAFIAQVRTSLGL